MGCVRARAHSPREYLPERMTICRRLLMPSLPLPFFFLVTSTADMVNGFRTAFLSYE